MWIELQTFPDLTSPTVIAWVRDPAGKPLPGPVPSQAGMDLADTRQVGAPDRDEDKNPLQAIAYQREIYAIKAHGINAGNISFLTSLCQNVRVQISSNLFIVKSLDTKRRDTIIKAFRAYDRANDGDPIIFAAKNMGDDIKADMFSVLPSYVIERNGKPVLHTEQKDEFEKFIKGQVAGKIDASNQSIEEYMRDAEMMLVWLRSEALSDVPNTNQGSHKIDSATPGKDPIKAIQQIIDDDSKDMKCKPSVVDRYPVMTLFSWPEAKVEWVDTKINIGCGIFIVLRLPYFYTRNSELVLWVACGHVENFNQLSERQLEACLEKSALTGVVVGLATADVPAACAAFLAQFQAMVVNFAIQDAKCLVPELFVLTKNNPWTRV